MDNIIRSLELLIAFWRGKSIMCNCTVIGATIHNSSQGHFTITGSGIRPPDDEPSRPSNPNPSEPPSHWLSENEPEDSENAENSPPRKQGGTNIRYQS